MRRTLFLSLVVASALGAPTSAYSVIDFDFTKHFTFTANTPVNQWATRFDWDVSAFAWEKPNSPVTRHEFDFLNWNGNGTDTHSTTATASANCLARAESSGISQVTATTYDGYATVIGTSVCNPGAIRQTRERAESRILAAAGQVVSGQIQWRPAGGIRSSGQISPQTGRLTDPMHFEVFNLDTNEDYFNQFLKMQIDLLDTGPGEVLFADGDMSVTARDVTFSLTISDPFIAESGYAFLTVSNGVVTSSSDGGIFDGRLPGLGTLTGFTVDVDPGPLNFNLSPFGTHLATSIGASSAGEFARSAVPEPASLCGAATGLAMLAIRRRRKSSSVHR